MATMTETGMDPFISMMAVLQARTGAEEVRIVYRGNRIRFHLIWADEDETWFEWDAWAIGAHTPSNMAHRVTMLLEQEK